MAFENAKYEPEEAETGRIASFACWKGEKIDGDNKNIVPRGEELRVTDAKDVEGTGNQQILYFENEHGEKFMAYVYPRDIAPCRREWNSWAEWGRVVWKKTGTRFTLYPQENQTPKAENIAQ